MFIIFVSILYCVNSVLLGATPFQIFNENMYSRFTLKDDLLKDVDIVSIEDNGFYGVPWEYFLNPSTKTYPTVWKNELDKIKSWLGDTPVFLSLGLIDQVGCPVRNATVDKHGNLHPRKFKNCYKCFNFSASEEITKAYVSYVLFMIDFYEPKYLNYAVEINTYRRICGLELFQGVIDTLNDIYYSVHQQHVFLPAFPSFINFGIYASDPCTPSDNFTTCTLTHLEELSTIKRDKFALSTYPFLESKALGLPIEKTRSLISHTFEIVTEYQYDLYLLISETGTTSTSIIVDKSDDPEEKTHVDCINSIVSNISTASEDLKYILQLGELLPNLEMINLFSYYNALPEKLLTSSMCPCSLIPSVNSEQEDWKLWCQNVHDAREVSPNPSIGEFMYKVFGSMGLKSYDTETENELHKIWTNFRKQQQQK